MTHLSEAWDSEPKLSRKYGIVLRSTRAHLCQRRGGDHPDGFGAQQISHKRHHCGLAMDMLHTQASLGGCMSPKDRARLFEWADEGSRNCGVPVHAKPHTKSWGIWRGAKQRVD